MAVTFGCCSKVSHYGSFGLNTMTWCSTWNCGEKRSFSGLCVEALLEYAIIQWGRTLALISVLPIAKQNSINSFDKAWRGQSLLYCQDDINIRWSYQLPLMGLFFQLLISCWFITLWLCVRFFVCWSLGCVLFRNEVFFHLCPKNKINVKYVSISLLGLSQD